MASNGKDSDKVAVKEISNICKRSAVTNAIKCSECKLVYHSRYCEIKNMISDDNEVLC